MNIASAAHRPWRNSEPGTGMHHSSAITDQKMAGTQIYQEVVYNFNMSKASAWAICLLLLSALGLALLRAAEAALVPKADR